MTQAHKLQTDYMKYYNLDIVAEAEKHIGKHGGQCKVFVQKIIQDVCGVTVPMNAKDVRKKYQWCDKAPVKNLQMCTYTKYLTTLQRGDAVQTLWDKKIVNTKYHWHTWIYLGEEDRQFIMLDSNWYIDIDKDGKINENEKEIVHIHKVDTDWFHRANERSTVYRVVKE